MSGPRDVADLAAAVGLEPARHRRADVESLVGIPHTDMLRWWRAIGLAEVPEEEVAFGDDDIRMAVALGALLGGGAVDDRDVLRLARVLFVVLPDRRGAGGAPHRRGPRRARR